MRNPLTPNPWIANEHGQWCPACGQHVANPIGEDGDEVPDTCRQCGFPDFEDGVGYFTDED